MLKGDCRATLAALAPGSVQSVITSPPYYALRDYGSPPLVWGGDPEHAHEWGELLPARKPGQVAQTKWANVSAVADGQRAAAGSECACGAWLGGLGLEPTPALFVEHLVECFRHVRRVLREDGVLWLNLGDSYSSGGRTSTAEPRGIVGQRGWLSGQGRRPPVIDGAKPKDLLMIPFRAALALQADGWYLRSVIPWVKRNPMPESVLDRPSGAIEYVFLLAKSESYYWDADSVRAATVSLDPRHPSYRPNSAAISENGRKEYSAKHEMSARQYSEAGRNRRNSDWFFESWQGLMLDEEGEALALVVNPAPFAGAHYATFPPKLIEPMIRASTSERGQCPACGKPWERVTEPALVPTRKAAKTFVVDERDEKADANDQGSNRQKDGHKPGWIRADTTVGWRAGCEHTAEPVPQRVLDPFGGAGTVGLVADRLGRDATLCELSPDYSAMGSTRIVSDAPLFAQLELLSE